MNWHSRLTSLKYSHPEGRFSLRQELCPPATDNEIDEAENRLQLRFPRSLRSLLLESNGVMGMMSIDGEEWFENLWTVWPLDEITQQNLWHRERYAGRNLSGFLFFVTAGVDGIQFGFRGRTENADDAAVYAWYPDETDDKLMVDRLDSFLEAWCCGRLSV
jgi:hypothetical protein